MAEDSQRAVESGQIDFQAVYKTELDEVAKRWKNTYRKRERELESGEPTPQNGLVGLALSGGGVRSATFNLGLVQALHQEGVFKHVDLMSTVSGGGYLGSSLSALMREGSESPEESFPFPLAEGTVESRFVSWLRGRSSSVAERGLLAYLQGAAEGVRGVLVNLLTLLPMLLGVAVLTSVWRRYLLLGWERGGDATLWSTFQWTPWFVFAALGYLLLSPLILQIFSGRRARSGVRQGAESAVLVRHAYGRTLGGAMLVAVVVPLLEALPIFIHGFHALADSPTLRGFLVVGGPLVSIGCLALAGRVLVSLTGFARSLLFAVLGLLALVVPLLLVVYVAEFLAYPRGGFERWGILGLEYWIALLVVVGLMALGTLYSMIVSRRISGLQLGLFFLQVFVGLWFWFAYFNLLRENPFGFQFRSYLVHNDDLWVLSAALVIWLFNWQYLDINLSSALSGFRDRLAAAYLIGRDASGKISVEEDLNLQQICNYDSGSTAPYHLINASLNLHGSRSGVARDRQAAFFLFSKRFIGSRLTGYCHTRALESVFPQMGLATAMAVSGAGASPGVQRFDGSLTSLLTVYMNIRAGYWLPNPGALHRWSGFGNESAPSRSPLDSVANRFRWRIPPRRLLSESLGRFDETHDSVNVTDGGHCDNTGAMELLRRRCKYIFVGDAEADPSQSFSGLAVLIRTARTDLGVDIDIDLDELQLGKGGSSRNHFALGRITYPGEKEFGYLLYLKASVTGDEDRVISEHQDRNPAFPHESSAYQYLADGQFEAYRALGEHIGRKALEFAPGRKEKFTDLQSWFSELENHLPIRWGRTEPSAKAPERPMPPEALLDACKRADCVLFAGSDIGAAAGYPTRKRLLLDLADRAEDKSVAELTHKGELASAAEILGSTLTTGLVQEELQKAYGESRDAEELAGVLERIRFLSAVTTGWDDVLSQAYPTGTVVVPQDEKALSESEDDAERSRFVLAKLYGDLSDPETLLLSPTLVWDEIATNRTLQRFRSTQCASHTYFFCGASLEEIEDFLTAFRVRGDSDQEHFALVEREAGLDAKRPLFKRRYGIEIVAFDPTPGGRELLDFLEELAEVAPARIERAQPTGMVEARTLESIYLKNIGAFEEERLEFHDGWNVLLGNNGCGKSTVLKAIALALCGEDERIREAAGELLRWGEKKGVIELKVGSEIFRTTIESLRSRIVVKATKETPLERGQWAAMAFPPLRGVSEVESKGPSATEDDGRPDVSDVLPLLAGTVDTRMDSLKQWIVNTHTLATKTGPRAAAADVLLTSFFSLMQELMPGVKVERPFETRDGKEVDVTVDDNFKVWIKTDDGRVPLGLVSQGMHSVLGWAGHALQRLSAIYPDSEKPENEPALVLVDELDAHMHPKWQVLLAPSVKSRFEKLQVIATSHSPLIAANMGQEEIRIVQRDETGVSIHRTPESFKGWRVDQILTSLAFNLEGARDAETNRDFKRYLELASKFDPSESEKDELEVLAQSLNTELPSAESRARAMKASKILNASIQSHLAELPEEDQEEVLTEIKVQLQGLDTEVGPE